MPTGEIYIFTIVKDSVTTISKDYCFLSDFDAKIQSYVLFLLSAEIKK